jgi:protein arginine kinase activator
MKCDVCKEAEAKIHLTQIVNGKVQKVDMCEACAKAKGVSDPKAYSLADLLLGMEGGEGAAPATVTGSQCSACGMKQSDFKKSGRLGCARCYDTFSEALSPLLKSMHKGVQHLGKRPSHYAKDLPTEEEIRQLRAELEKAVRTENYEMAAELRNRVRKLEEDLKKGHAGPGKI